jgi:hypothetical protein
MAGKKKPPAEPPPPHEEPPLPPAESAARPRRRWINIGLVLGCMSSVSTGGLVAVDKLHLSQSTTLKTMVLSPIVGWLLGVMGHLVRALIDWGTMTVRALIDWGTMLIARQTMIEEELARTFSQVAREDAQRGPVQAGQTQDTTVKRLPGGSYRLTRSTKKAPAKPPSPGTSQRGRGPIASGGNGHMRGRGSHRLRGRR